MKTTMKRGMALLLICVTYALSGCSNCGLSSCVAPHADLPATVAPGETLTIEVKDLWATCNDRGCDGPNEPMSNVTIEAVLVGTEDVVASATASVNDEATAQITLSIPPDADGSVTIRTSDAVYGFGTVEIVRE